MNLKTGDGVWCGKEYHPGSGETFDFQRNSRSQGGKDLVRTWSVTTPVDMDPLGLGADYGGQDGLWPWIW